MKKINVKILDKLIGDIYPLPTYATSGSAGLDLRASTKNPIILDSGEKTIVKTGISIHINDINFAGIILPRSGIGHKDGIILGNSVGLIDSDYQGPLLISIWNSSKKEFIIRPYERIAQMIFIRIARIKFNVITDFINSERGTGCFGHSGTD